MGGNKLERKPTGKKNHSSPIWGRAAAKGAEKGEEGQKRNWTRGASEKGFGGAKKSETRQERGKSSGRCW